MDALLREQEPATFAGVWIDNGVTYRVTAGFTRDGDRVLPAYAAKAGLAGVAVAVPVTYTLAQLRQDMQTVMPIAKSVHADVSLNLPANQVELLTTSPEQVAAAAAGAGVTLPASVKVVQVPSTSHLLADIYGGLPLDGNGCTSGFGVSHDGTPDRGITTAGHCGDTASYQGQPLTFQQGLFGFAHDEQWHTAFAFMVRNWIDDGLGGRFITSRTPRSQQVPGQAVCRYGRITGYNCGTIDSTSFAPDCIPGGTTSWVTVTPSTGQVGDSGGPMFFGNSAYGQVACGGPYDIYVAVDMMEFGLGVTVLTGP